MEKKLFLAIGLSALVLLTFNFYLSKIAPPASQQQEIVLSEEAGGETEREINLPAGEEEGWAGKEAGEINVSTALYNATISLNGGGFASLSFKSYKNKDGELINLIRPERKINDLPLYVSFPGVPALIFEEAQDVVREEDTGDKTLVLKARADGWGITKKLTFSHEEYLVWLEMNWENQSEEKRLLPDYYLVCAPGLGPEDRENKQFAEIRAGMFLGDQLKSIKWRVSSLAKKLIKKNNSTGTVVRLEEEKRGPVQWLAYREKYFAAVLSPREKGQGVLLSGVGEDGVLCQIRMTGQEIDPGKTLTQKVAVYLGPVDYDGMKKLNLGIESIFDSGVLAPLRRLVMVVLKFFYRLVGNWGVAIILLTIVVKIILLPLTQKSFRSMKEMQKLQPQISSLRQVYKDDPQRMQKEMMELYRRHKVNPLGGCFPMLLQMPVFIALFTALRGAIELWQAPFIFWIKDLSVKDPYYVLPALMGATMFLQQKLTPTADPQQARMAMMMPIVFTFLFMNFPSGLVLYWLVNSLLSLVEQWWIKRDRT